jgi:cell division protein FtsL
MDLTEMNRALHLEEASLRDPERIDVMARKLGLQSPQPGQVTSHGLPAMRRRR